MEFSKHNNLAKKNRKRPGATNDPSNKKISTSNSHDNTNKKIDVASEEPLNTETLYCKKSDVQV